MMGKFGQLGAFAAVSLLFVAACDDAPEEETASETETGGTASGDVLGGTISDDMIPMEELTSTSPPAERTVVTTQESRSDGGQTTVETTVETTLETNVDTNVGGDGPPQPEPPETPAAPE